MLLNIEYAFSLLKGEGAWWPLRALLVFEKVEKFGQELRSLDLLRNIKNNNTKAFFY
jgi:hypothetical protein